MMRNTNINWAKVKRFFMEAKDGDEIHNLWNAVDAKCYGREDVEQLDELAEKARALLPKTIVESVP